MTVERTTTPDPTHEPDTVPWLKRECDQLGNAVLAAEHEKEALSWLLRGMARRVGKHRVAFDDLRRHMIRVGGKIERERDEARAELARVRPVVDAARAWGDSPPENSDSADALLDAVAALDEGGAS